MRTRFIVLAGIVGVGAVPQFNTADILPNPPSTMSSGAVSATFSHPSILQNIFTDHQQKTCVYNMYDQARTSQSEILCSNDRSPACVCKAASVRFWYGLRDCSLGFGQDVYTEVASWKDNALCRNGGAAIRPATTARPSTTQPAKPAAPTAAPQVTLIPYVEDGVTSYITRTLKPSPVPTAKT
jgi:hypothetical protein